MFNWGVIFLIKAADKHWAYAEEMISDILSCKNTDQVGVLFCLNGRVELLKRLLPEHIKNERSNDEITTVFFKLEVNQGSRLNFLDFILEERDFKIQSKHDISKYFKTLVLPRCQATHYMLFTWDHGSAFGIFREGETIGDPKHIHLFDEIIKVGDKKYQFVTLTNNDEISSQFFLTRYSDFLKDNLDILNDMPEEQKDLLTREVLRVRPEPDPTGFDMLNADEIRDAIQTAFDLRGGRIEIVCMMNCCMQFFDTGLTLKDATDYLIAPETIMDFNGYNYQEIFYRLFKNPHLKADELASIIVSSFKEKKYKDEEEGKVAKDNTGLFANELRYYKDVAEIINDFAADLIQNSSSEIGLIQNCRSKFSIMPYSGRYQLLDFFNFVKELNTDSGLQPWTNEVVLDIEALITSILNQRSHIGDNVSVSQDNKIIKPSGFSIYFPEQKKQTRNNYYNYFIRENSKWATSFSKNFRWDNFVLEFLTRVG